MKYLKLAFLKKLAFSGLIFIILLVLAELILSWLEIYPDEYYIHSPNVSYSFEENPSQVDGISGYYQIAYDELGSRSISDYKKATHKIVALGGSTTVCSVLTQEKNWTARLEKKLGEAYWVGNFGASGHSSNHHVLQFKHILDKPELKDTETVLMLVGVNDCRGYLISQEKYLHMPKMETKIRSFKHLPNSELPFLRRLTLFKLAKQARLKWRYYTSPRKPLDYLKTYESKTEPIKKLPNLDAGLTHYENNLRQIIAEAKKRNISIVFMTQPTIWEKELSEEIAVLLASRSHYNRTPLYTGEALNKIMTAFNKRLVQVCKDTQTEYIDLELIKNENVFYDDMHFDEAGAEVVATKIYEYLKTK